MLSPLAIAGYYLITGVVFVLIRWLSGSMAKDIKGKIGGRKPTLWYNILVSIRPTLAWPVHFFLFLLSVVFHLRYFLLIRQDEWSSAIGKFIENHLTKEHKAEKGREHKEKNK